MDVRERIEELVAGTAVLPPTEEPSTVFARGRRRAGRRRTVIAGGALGVAGVVVAAAVALAVLPGGATQLPIIGDGPEPGEDAEIGDGADIDDTPDPDEVTIPDGWQTLTAGEIAVSVPPDWEVVRPLESLPFDPHDAPENAAVGGPCHYTLYPDVFRSDDRPRPEGPMAVVYDAPTDGACRLIGISGPPPRPGLVLYETQRGIVDGVEDQLGAELVDIEQRAERDRIGAIEVWRTVDDEQTSDLEPSGMVFYVAAELTGGIWVAHPEDPVVQRILATARPIAGAEPRERGTHRTFRDLDADEWQLLGGGATDGYISGGRVLETQAELDRLWDRLDLDGTPPTIPEGMAAIAGPTYAGGLPGGCHRTRDVVGVRMRGSGGNILLGPLTPGHESACSEDPIVHVIALPPEIAEGFGHVATEVVGDRPIG